MGTVEELTGLIPVVVAGGVVLKVTEAALESVNRLQGSTKKTSRKAPKRPKKTIPGLGNFSNVGF